MKFILCFFLTLLLFASCTEEEVPPVIESLRGEACNEKQPCASGLLCENKQCVDIYLTEKEIPDPNFRKCLEIEYKNLRPKGFPGGIYPWGGKGINLYNVQRTPMLECDEYILKEYGIGKIERLKGIEYFKKLEMLTLRSNHIKDLALVDMPKTLTDLTLAENQLHDSDIEFLKDPVYFHQMTYLVLHSNHFTDLSFLENYTSLELLGLDDNDIGEISFIKNNKNLRKLSVSEMNLKSIEVLSELENLESLYLYENYITDISPIANLKKLQSLYIRRNCVPNCIQYPDQENTFNCPVLQNIIDMNIDLDLSFQFPRVCENNITWEEFLRG